jgi:diguanylate cyclase
LNTDASSDSEDHLELFTPRAAREHCRWYGALKSPDLEQRYLAETRASRYQVVFWVTVLTGLAYLLSGFTLLARGGLTQYALVIFGISRVGAWVLSLTAAIAAWRRAPERALQALLLLYLLSVGLGEVLELWFAPVQSSATLPITALMVLTFYILNPLYLTVSLFGGALTTLGYVISLVLSTRLPFPDVADTVITMVLMNAVGGYFQVSLQVRRRTEFVSLVRARDQNEELSAEIERRQSLEDQLRTLAETDSLTGIYNRRFFTTAAEHEVKRCLRYGHTLSLIIADIDRFKRINDRYGHTTGDSVLKRTVEIIKQSLREVDTLARVGGEEFAVLLPDTTADGARQVAERIRSAIATAEQPVPSSGAGVTISLGVAELAASDDDFDLLYRRADRALYASKDRGRNRVSVSDE